MACCAFAVFVLGQILAALAWLRRRLPRRLRPAASAPCEVDPVTSWQLLPAGPGLAPASPVRQGPSGLRRALLVAAGIELAILGVGAIGLAASRSHSAPDRTPGTAAGGLTSFWCRSLLAPVTAPREP